MQAIKTQRPSRSVSPELEPGTPKYCQPDAERPAIDSLPPAAHPSQSREAPGNAPCLQDLSCAALLIGSSLKRPQPAIDGVQPQVKRRKQQYQHGNYRNYYGYRLQGGLEADPRVEVRSMLFMSALLPQQTYLKLEVTDAFTWRSSTSLSLLQ